MFHNHHLGGLAFSCAAVLAAFASWTARAVAPDALGSPGTLGGYCLSFDGVDDVVAVTRTVALEPGEITVELWARLDGRQDWNSRLLRKGEHDAYFITADQDFDEHMQFLITRGADVQLSAEDTQPHTAYNGTWHHFLGVYALDHVEFWVDGELVSSVTHDLGALTHLPLTDLYIGAGLPVTMPNEYFAGRIDEVRIWNYPRTAAQIQASWYRSVSSSEPGLVAYWRFDDGGGQVAHDSSAYGHDGMLGSSTAADPADPTWTVSDVPLGSATPAGYCLAFDGVDDFVRVPRSPSLEPEEITVELWARLDAPQSLNTRLLRKAAHFSPGYFIAADQDDDQRMQFIVNFGSHIVQAKDPAPQASYVGSWHHFAGVYTKRIAEFFVDGRLVRRVKHDEGPLLHEPLTDLFIGAGIPSPDPSEYFQGLIDEVRIWDRPLSHREVAASAFRRMTGKEVGLVAYWNFDEGAGQVAYDTSAAGNHGELGSSPGGDGTDPLWIVSDAPIDR